MGRDSDEGFNEDQIGLNWNVTAVTNTSITFQIIFDDPYQISPLD